MNIPTPEITTGNLPAARKIYVNGSLPPNIRVPMRKISVHPSAGEPALTVCDNSGAYTDAAIETNIQQGLPALRREWIRAVMDMAMTAQTTFLNKLGIMCLPLIERTGRGVVRAAPLQRPLHVDWRKAMNCPKRVRWCNGLSHNGLQRPNIWRTE